MAPGRPLEPELPSEQVLLSELVRPLELELLLELGIPSELVLLSELVRPLELGIPLEPELLSELEFLLEQGRPLELQAYSRHEYKSSSFQQQLLNSLLYLPE